MGPQQETRVALATLGCKLNQAETETLAKQLSQAGYALVDFGNDMDIFILNSCTVTHIADRKARHLLRLGRRRNPQAFIVATGCYAQRAPQELGDAEAVDLLIPQKEKGQLVKIMSEKLGTPSAGPFPEYPRRRTRSFIKIQDGCHDFCAYCVVPQVRGRGHSLPSQGIIDTVKARVSQGYREVVLTGTKLGSYAWSGLDLAGLVKRLLLETAVERLHLSSLQPQEITPELLNLWADARLCRHIHIPLQSGSPHILEAMGRKYTVELYSQMVRQIREAVPDIAITTDIIVGFPGEREEDFEASLRFCRKLGFSAIHVFPYSPRPGTRAARLPSPVSPQIKRARMEMLQLLAEESSYRYHQQCLGQVRPVLWEKEVEPGMWSGLTDNYVRVQAPIQGNLANNISWVRLLALQDGHLWGEPVKMPLEVPHFR